MFHHRLVILGTPLGDSLRRFYEITGDELNLKFPAVTNQGQEIRTVVTLKRISGESEMIQNRSVGLQPGRQPPEGGRYDEERQ